MNTENHSPANVSLSTRNSLGVTMALAVLSRLAEISTERVLGPIRSINVKEGREITVYIGTGDRRSNVKVDLELSQVEVAPSRHSCFFTGRVSDELHSASYPPFSGRCEHEQDGLKVELLSSSVRAA